MLYPFYRDESCAGSHIIVQVYIYLSVVLQVGDTARSMVDSERLLACIVIVYLDDLAVRGLCMHACLHSVGILRGRPRLCRCVYDYPHYPRGR